MIRLCNYTAPIHLKEIPYIYTINTKLHNTFKQKKNKHCINSHFEDLLPRCSLSTVSLDHSTFFSVFLFLSLIVRLRPSCNMWEVCYEILGIKCSLDSNDYTQKLGQTPQKRCMELSVYFHVISQCPVCMFPFTCHMNVCAGQMK